MSSITKSLQTKDKMYFAFIFYIGGYTLCMDSADTATTDDSNASPTSVERDFEMRIDAEGAGITRVD